MWTWSLPWRKVLDAVVAELGIHKLSDECLGAKLRVTENRCVIFNRSTYVYIYIYIYIYIPRLRCGVKMKSAQYHYK